LVSLYGLQVPLKLLLEAHDLLLALSFPLSPLGSVQVLQELLLEPHDLLLALGFPLGPLGRLQVLQELLLLTHDLLLSLQFSLHLRRILGGLGHRLLALLSRRLVLL
jgi:hypothetical protein